MTRGHIFRPFDFQCSPIFKLKILTKTCVRLKQDKNLFVQTISRCLWLLECQDHAVILHSTNLHHPIGRFLKASPHLVFPLICGGKVVHAATAYIHFSLQPRFCNLRSFVTKTRGEKVGVFSYFSQKKSPYFSPKNAKHSQPFSMFHSTINYEYVWSKKVPEWLKVLKSWMP